MGCQLLGDFGRPFGTWMVLCYEWNVFGLCFGFRAALRSLRVLRPERFLGMRQWGTSCKSSLYVFSFSTLDWYILARNGGRCPPRGLMDRAHIHTLWRLTDFLSDCLRTRMGSGGRSSTSLRVYHTTTIPRRARQCGRSRRDS